MEAERTNTESPPVSLTGMSRATKLFIKVDKEGFLIDSLAISDVVNFDCIESIVTSAKRIISLFNDVSPKEVAITGLFYYKKRARSLRMNPMPLVTTTDGFRAVAEHPSGEIPIGVEWEKKNIKSVQTHAGEKRQRSESPASKKSETEVHEKKLKLEVPAKYKTYMPSSSADTAASTTTTTTFTSSEEPPLLLIRQRPEDVASSQKNVAGVNQLFGMPAVGQFAQPLNSEDVKKAVNQKLLNGEDSAKRNPRQTKSAYHWTEDVSCEVILSYDGVSERKKLKPRLCPVIQSLIKGDYTVLREDLMLDLRDDTNQEMLNSFSYKEDEKQKPISYLSEAKMEVFKILSMLCLSKARFKDLLDWMKTLKLEEGNQGKYYLSERNIVGGGLRVMYDTDEMAAAKLNSLQKFRSSKANTKTKVLFPITPYERAVNSLNPKDNNKSVMLMVPSSNAPGTSVPTTAVAASNPKPGNAQFSLFPTLPVGHSLVPVTMLRNPEQPHPAWSKEVLQNKAMEAKTSLVSLLPVNVSTQSVAPSSSNSSSKVTEAPRHTSRQPNILRSKTHFHSQKLVPPSGDPIPMHLYRSCKPGQDPINETEEHEDDFSDTIPVIIKQEPVEYNSDTTEDDNSKHSQEEASNEYKGVLNTDAEMPVDDVNNDLNMEVVIKTERVDDYDT